MEPTHFLYLIENPRKDFAATMTAAERELFGRHAACYREHAKQGLVLMAGPALTTPMASASLQRPTLRSPTRSEPETQWSGKD